MSADRSDFTPWLRVFEAAEALAGDPSREALEARLAQYRQVSSAVGRLGSVAPQSPADPVQPEVALVQAAAPAPPEPSLEDTVAAAQREASAAVVALKELERQGAQTQPATHRRVTLAATLFAVGLAVVIFLGAKLSQQTEPVDLAKGKPWHASSTLFPCYPERIDCGGAKTTIFFHTQEENEPWVVIDLQAPTQFKSVSVVNRRDAAKERAAPLVLEVSDDEKAWRELARREEEFSVWRPKFEQTTARYVRLKSLKKTYLHLDAVKVHP